MDKSFSDWVGNSEERHDTIGAFPANALSATLNLTETFHVGSSLPPLWHWLYFLPIFRLNQRNYDGHAALGGFLPPITLPRRMWAGSRVTFPRSLIVGKDAHKVSTIKSIQEKSGKSGELIFVNVAHQVFQDSQLCIEEEHDIVYRNAPTGANVQSALVKSIETPEFAVQVHPDPVLLFRYSALTFNGHRIHYDHPFCVNTEGYDGLVVHGPLLATMMLELVRNEFPEKKIVNFQFRAIAPIFDTTDFEVCGRKLSGSEIEIWVRRDDDVLAMMGFAKIIED